MAARWTARVERLLTPNHGPLPLRLREGSTPHHMMKKENERDGQEGRKVRISEGFKGVTIFFFSSTLEACPPRCTMDGLSKNYYSSIVSVRGRVVCKDLNTIKYCTSDKL